MTCPILIFENKDMYDSDREHGINIQLKYLMTLWLKYHGFVKVSVHYQFIKSLLEKLSNEKDSWIQTHLINHFLTEFACRLSCRTSSHNTRLLSIGWKISKITVASGDSGGNYWAGFGVTWRWKRQRQWYSKRLLADKHGRPDFERKYNCDWYAVCIEAGIVLFFMLIFIRAALLPLKIYVNKAEIASVI